MIVYSVGGGYVCYHPAPAKPWAGSRGLASFEAELCRRNERVLRGMEGSAVADEDAGGAVRVGG